MTTTDTDISKAFAVAAEYEEQSDAAFARGDVVHGAQYLRHASLAYSFAEELARRNLASGTGI